MGRFRLVVCAAAGAAGGMIGGAVSAKSKDTPGYLVPHYLTTLRSRYNHYATNDEQGRRAMSAEDFLRSVSCAKRRSAPVPSTAAEDLRGLFRMITCSDEGRESQEGEGKLGFGEYALLMTFLTTPRIHFERAFGIFDSTETGAIGRDEFREVVSSLCHDRSAHRRIALEGSVSRMLFGSHGKQRVSFDDFWRFVSDVRASVWRAEFLQYDPEGTGEITPAQFAKLLLSPVVGSHLPFFLVKNIRKMEQMQSTVSMASWERFNILMLDADRLSECIRTFTASGLLMSRSDFTRAVKFVQPKGPEGQKLVSPALQRDIELLYALFDRGEGHLDHEELLAFAQARTTLNVAAAKEEEPIPIGRLVIKCLGEAIYHQRLINALLQLS
eukprot:Hpha_TRINITY_DN3322_c0_g1::TRINITY_DN3322_c0_g1_i1::g.172219::m.172219